MFGKRCEYHHDLAGPAISFDDVWFRYPGTDWVLQDVTLEIPTCTHTCLIGPNGSGKSTLMKLALGLLDPDRGSIRTFGTPPHRACRHVGYVPQHSQIRRGFPITVREVVLTGCVDRHVLGWHRPSCGIDADRIMGDLGIAHIAGTPFDQLSGGQRQRVLIARALVGNPSLLLLDEPTANIDPAVANQVRDLLVRLSGEFSVVTVSHDLTYITDSLDSVFLVDRTVRELGPEEITSDAVWDLYSHRALATAHA